MSLPIDERWLFIKTCQDLAKKSQSPELYDKLRMAGLLAQLLFGPRALCRIVAGPQPLEFWYREPHEKDFAQWKSSVGFDASTQRGDGGKTQRAPVEQFLRARVIYLGRWWSVEQVVASVAHAYGGLYGTVPPDTGHDDFVAFNHELNVGGAAGRIPVALHEITQVTLRALLPLAEIAGANFDQQKRSSAPSPKAEPGKCPFNYGLPKDE